MLHFIVNATAHFIHNFANICTVFAVERKVLVFYSMVLKRTHCKVLMTRSSSRYRRVAFELLLMVENVNVRGEAIIVFGKFLMDFKYNLLKVDVLKIC